MRHNEFNMFQIYKTFVEMNAIAMQIYSISPFKIMMLLLKLPFQEECNDSKLARIVLK